MTRRPRPANVPEGFAIFELPPAHRMRCRTVNGLERLNKEIARRRGQVSALRTQNY
jgi:hypothetical protein